MNYDFTTIVNRRGTGSGKWDEMYRKKPDVSEGVIPLSIADMELANPPEVIEGLRDFMSTAVLGYTSPTPAYRRAVASWLKSRHNWNIEEEWMLQTPGVVSAIFAAVNALTKEGEGVIIQPPVYYPLAMAININKRTLVENPLIASEEGHYSIDFEDLERKAADPNNKLLILCSPHNPVGRVWTAKELSRLSEICLANNIFVVSDEIHGDIVLPGHKHTVYATLSEAARDNCLICTSPSKSFNLAGMQVSNIIIPNRQARERIVRHYMKSAQFSINVIGMKACEIAYSKCGPWLDELLLLIDANKSLLESFIQDRLPKVKVSPLEGTYLMWLDFRSFGLNRKELESFMTQEAELFLDEGYIFGEQGVGFERINIACPTFALREALERLSLAAGKRGFA